MSKLAEFKALEAKLAEQLAQLDAMKNDESLKKEIEFESKLRDLMDEYDMNLGSIKSILDPQSHRASSATRGQNQGQGQQRKARKVKTYKHPQTGEVIETKGGNHKLLKEWKAEHGADEVEGWLQN
jgi:hypothetical protein